MRRRKEDIFLYPYKVENVLATLSQSKGWQITQLRVPDAWKITKGKGIKVMVIDTGYTDHPDLEDALIENECLSFLRFEREKDDFNGHSSHVCGIIGARDNHIGMVGVAPECTIITAKVLGRNGTGDFEAMRAALRFAKEVKPDVINMSLGSHQYDATMHRLIKDLYDMNIPIIAASGNDGRGNAVNYPAKYPEVICVTAYDKNGRPARFNSTGPQADFSAPGVDIYSTWINHTYVSISGTSMATPFVAGLVALLLAKHKIQEKYTGKNDCRTVDEIKQHLIKYADDKGVVGRDDVWGYGVIDPVRAIEALRDEGWGVVPDLPEEVPNPPKSRNPFKRFLERFLSFFR